ncbi:AMIN domain-containing protein [Leptolyngbya sp. FACHB-17]|uniref:AMIN domain-containing protein n=1 Tax=unclassified Leptolyngbya TaxID=2650499 RepID=UPI0016817030|nr:AMIN domain-containing protein [Leptolyngbya sp. FACHB-17]
MKELRFLSLATAATLALVSHPPASANPTQVTNVMVNPNGSGFDVVLQTQGEKPPQVFNVNRGNTWNAYVFNAQIAQPYRQNNPAPGIAQVSVTPSGANGVQVSVVGTNAAPIGQIASRNAQGVIFNVAGAGGGTPNAAVPVNVPPAGSKMAQAVPAQATPSAPLPTTPVAQAMPNSTTPIAPFVPSAQVPNQGQPTVPVAPVPPLQRRAVAPPVGDISVSQSDASPSTIDLGTNERIPRLVLRNAPVREVLSLLARAARLNLAYSEASDGQQSQGSTPEAKPNGPTISLDIENESVQDVFNYVLRVTCVPISATTSSSSSSGSAQCASLEATRSGKTIFVGTRLPNAARGIIVRSVRLNQAPVATALNVLVGLGAESANNPTQRVTSVSSAAQIGSQNSNQQNTQQNNNSTVSDTELKAQRIEFQDSVPLLRGLQALGDERTNTITLIGTPKQVDLAVNQLVLADVRRRMVAVNVRVVDVNLAGLSQIGTSFSFGLGNNQFVNSNGIAVFNFGTRTPGEAFGLFSTPGQGNVGTGIAPITNGIPVVNFARNFLAQLQGAVSNGNAKILTDPTLVVQEGQTATVNLIQEVVTNFTQQTTFGTGASQSTITVEKKPAGLILPVKVDRIDDNGFISLSIAPSISQPDGAQVININGSTNSIILLSERRLDSGQIRLRDGQTLVLSGIIQDQDRVSTTKVPILGDIPLLGALFRRTDRSNQRREVIVLVTPQIMDDSDQSTFGYGYVPGRETRQFLQQQENR